MADTLYIGIRCRHSEALVGSYFDEDMPADWRMDYLASVTTALWLDSRDEDAEVLLEAVAEAPRAVALVLDTQGEAVPTVVRDWLAGQPEPVLFELSAVDREAWRPDGDVRGASVGLIPASDQPATLRGWIETFAAQAPGGAAALLIDGDPPSTATLDRVQSLAEMMGLD